MNMKNRYFREAELFCTTTPHKQAPYNKRNWGGTLHSICSYQGKLKPSIAHFLVEMFTNPGDTILDPMAGVGTIPLEARRLGRVGHANDLSPFAYSICSAKLGKVSSKRVDSCVNELSKRINSDTSITVESAIAKTSWGLNGNISDYFHPTTLRELLVARRFFQEIQSKCGPSENLVLASLLHILHGNRPYALSRNSHPITPFSPTGEFEYRSVIERLQNRIDTVLPLVVDLAKQSSPGTTTLGDFRNLKFKDVDAIITSPPFTNSFRFWSANWMRLWFSGWEPESFKTEPPKFLESEQKVSYEPYREFSYSAAKTLGPGGRLILHLGENSKDNMADEIKPMIEDFFRIIYIGRENVQDTESHGLTDKGSTSAHLYLFAERNSKTP